MSLLRTTEADREPPWGKSLPVEDSFDLPGRGCIVAVKARIPGSHCRVTVHPPAGEVFDADAQVGRFIGDHAQSDLLILGRTAQELPRGTTITFPEAP